MTVLPDPAPPGVRDGRWWPPVMLTEAWVAGHADAFDLMHLHFGSEALSTRELATVLDTLRRTRRPLVCTIHDISHPQLGDQRRHQEHLTLLMAHAHEIVTLTGAAADEIRRRWGRRAEVIAHPHMYPLETPFPRTSSHAEPMVGLDLRDLRPNIDGLDATRTLIDAVCGLRARGTAIRVRVQLRDRVRDPSAAAQLRALCAPLAWVELIEAPRLGDDALARSLCGLDATVLPYGHGTHSGWLELCWDLGIPIVAPAIGHLGDQHDDPDHLRIYDPGDSAALADALADLLTRTPLPAGSPQRLQAQRTRRRRRFADQEAIRAAHLKVYRRALERERRRRLRTQQPVAAAGTLR